jgi:hypothetical protein
MDSKEINILHIVQDIFDDIEKLEKEASGMTDYLLLKVEQKDWHGVADAAMDIREIEAKLSSLNKQARILSSI